MVTVTALETRVTALETRVQGIEQSLATTLTEMKKMVIAISNLGARLSRLEPESATCVQDNLDHCLQQFPTLPELKTKNTLTMAGSNKTSRIEQDSITVEQDSTITKTLSAIQPLACTINPLKTVSVLPPQTTLHLQSNTAPVLAGQDLVSKHKDKISGHGVEPGSNSRLPSMTDILLNQESKKIIVDPGGGDVEATTLKLGQCSILVDPGGDASRSSMKAVERKKKMFDGGYVHHELLKSTIWLLDQESETWKRLWLETGSEYKMVLAGHSLGSGVAALLTMIVVNHRDKIRGIPRSNVRCYSVAPARCMSLNLAVKYADVVHSLATNIQQNLNHHHHQHIHEGTEHSYTKFVGIISSCFNITSPNFTLSSRMFLNDLSTAWEERKGSSQVSIAKFIKEKHKNRPANCRMFLLTPLKKLAAERLVKVKGSFKLSPTTVQATKPAAVKTKKTSPAAKTKAKAAANENASKKVAKASAKKAAPAKSKISAKPKPPPNLKHIGAHKINNVVAQALLAKHIGKKCIIAETGASQHGVATATVCARFGLQCIIYMGARDMERPSLNVFKMRLLGAEVRPVHSGTATLKDDISEAIRDWLTNVESTHHILGSAAGPHPYPMMVREFHARSKGSYAAFSLL